MVSIAALCDAVVRSSGQTSTFALPECAAPGPPAPKSDRLMIRANSHYITPATVYNQLSNESTRRISHLAGAYILLKLKRCEANTEVTEGTEGLLKGVIQQE